MSSLEPNLRTVCPKRETPLKTTSVWSCDVSLMSSCLNWVLGSQSLCWNLHVMLSNCADFASP
eukprot:1353514-Amphidinium_carterae.1